MDGHPVSGVGVPLTLKKLDLEDAFSFCGNFKKTTTHSTLYGAHS